jgi:hypothetical protein
MPVGASLDTKGREKKESAGFFRGKGKPFLLGVKDTGRARGSRRIPEEGASCKLSKASEICSRYSTLTTHRKEFILNKRALGRKKDQADLEALGVE